MGRPKRITKGNVVYHVLNRANGRLRIFKKRQDFEAFESILAEGIERYDMQLCGYCIMSNHWHLVLWPRNDGDLTNFMRWVTVTHTQRWHAAHGTSGTGHLYQGEQLRNYESQILGDECVILVPKTCSSPGRHKNLFT